MEVIRTRVGSNHYDGQSFQFAFHFHYATSKFFTIDTFFNKHKVAIFEGIVQSSSNICFCLNNFYTNTGTLVCSLNYYGHTKGFKNFFFNFRHIVIIAFVIHQAFRSADICRNQEAFCSNFIHCYCACQHATTGVRHFDCFQHTLQTTIFTIHAMHSVKNNFSVNFTQLFY